MTTIQEGLILFAFMCCVTGISYALRRETGRLFRGVLASLLVLLTPYAFPDDYKGQYSSNPYATPKANIQPGQTYNLYNSQGDYRGKIGASRYDSDSVTNPYGRYGSKYSSDSINNKYGIGSPYHPDSPSNKYGNGLRVFED